MSKFLHVLMVFCLLLAGGGIALDAQTTVSMTSFSAIEGNVGGDAHVSYKAEKGKSATKPAVNGDQIRVYQNGGLFTVSVADGYVLNNVTLGSDMSTKVTYVTDVTTKASSEQSIEKGKTLSVDFTSGEKSITFTCTGTSKSARLYVNSLSVTYSPAEVGKTITSLKFADGDKTFKQGQTDGLTFTNAATLTPAVEGAAITYSSSNENIAVVDNNGEVIVDAAKAGTATITASYAGNDNYTASTASYTITVEPVVQNIAALKAAYSSSDIKDILKLTDAQVTCVDGPAHYIQDASGAVNVYMSSGFDYKAGDKLNGFANVTYTLYNGLPEIKSFEPVGDITVTSGDAPAPTEMTITDAQKDENLCKYVVIKNVTVTPGSTSGNATAEDKDGNSITVYKKSQTYVAGQYDLTGIVSIYNKNKQIAFISYAPDFEIDEDADANAITAGDNATVTINRTFNGNAWNTLVLPFAMTADQLTKTFGSDAKFAKYTGTTKQADGYTLNFETVTATEANTPVFVWGAKSDVFTVEGVTVVKADAISAPANAAFSFSGSYDKTTAQSGDWFISSDNKFYSAAGTESIKPMRAVFRPVAATTNAKHLSFSIDGGETTGIKSISNNGVVLDDHAPAYNLAGQRVDSTYKGVVIQNGKKYIRK